MTKLHEILAVEGDVAGEYKKILSETGTTFSKKAELFFGFLRVLDMFEEGSPTPPAEFKEIDTTVQKKLDYQKKFIIRYFDLVLQKESTNQKATADIEVDGVVLAKDVPATFLLGLESKLKQLREVYNRIPTLPPGIKWLKDENKGEGVYITEKPEEQFKTEKVIIPQILYEATKEHPAQVEKITETKNVGKYSRTSWTGTISPAEKSALLGRLDKLSRAVKKARQRANTEPVVKRTIGKELFDYIHTV